MPEKTAIIFGDSIMKGTVYEGGRYRSCYTEVFLPQMEGLDIALDNRSRFGYTAERGLGLIKKAIAAGERPDYALVEYGRERLQLRLAGHRQRSGLPPSARHSPCRF